MRNRFSEAIKLLFYPCSCIVNLLVYVFIIILIYVIFKRIKTYFFLGINNFKYLNNSLICSNNVVSKYIQLICYVMLYLDINDLYIL